MFEKLCTTEQCGYELRTEYTHSLVLAFAIAADR